MGTSMHEWDAAAELLAASVVGYAVERIRLPKDSRWGARSAPELASALEGTVRPEGVGGHEALRLYRDVLMPACRPTDDPRNLAYVPTAPTVAATLFDLVVSASSVFGGMWESGAGAIAAENEALRWLADLAGFPAGAGGCFVSGGSAANLSALVTARHTARLRGRSPGDQGRWRFAATDDAHSSVYAAARVMDVDVVPVPLDDRGRLVAPALRASLERSGREGLFAVVASAGTTNAGAIDDLAGVAELCDVEGLWLHVDAAYGGAALCAPSVRPAFDGFERADSFGVDPHKWLFAPYDSAALVYREPALAAAAHAQHGGYLDAIDRDEWNPADYAFHLSRRARGLPLWFSLATYGTDAYRDAVERALATARAFAELVRDAPHTELLLDPELSVVLFRRRGWTLDDYRTWSRRRARDGFVLVVPTTWREEPCLRVCVLNPRTTVEDLADVLDDLAGPPGGPDA